MEVLKIIGGHKLQGEVEIRAGKNALLPILAASILCEHDITLENCPQLTDSENMMHIIRSLGGKANLIGREIHINCSGADTCTVSSELTSSIRSSIFILGSILSRFKMATVSYPGGCEIGARPIDLHIKGLRSLNVVIDEHDGFIFCDGRNMKGGTVYLDFPSVGATENIMMAGVLTKGLTVIHNAAREPEIVDLQNFIKALGGKIWGAGTECVVIEGVSSLHGATYRPIADRIVSGTFMIASAMCGGDVVINNCDVRHNQYLEYILSQAGVNIINYFHEKKARVISSTDLRSLPNLQTTPYPGFPTDLQAQVMAMESISIGTCVLVENLFENRFRHAYQLNKMGANIEIVDNKAIILGVKNLKGGNVESCDLRGGASLVLAGLVAKGETTVGGAHYIDRGYEKFERDLNSLGAQIARIEIK